MDVIKTAKINSKFTLFCRWNERYWHIEFKIKQASGIDLDIADIWNHIFDAEPLWYFNIMYNFISNSNDIDQTITYLNLAKNVLLSDKEISILEYNVDSSQEFTFSCQVCRIITIDYEYYSLTYQVPAINFSDEDQFSIDQKENLLEKIVFYRNKYNSTNTIFDFENNPIDEPLIITILESRQLINGIHILRVD